MGCTLDAIVVDARDPVAQARWWAAALEARVERADAAYGRVAQLPGADSLALDFLAVPEPKRTKNRLHLDLRAPDQQMLVDRLIGAGARLADVGQSSDVSWVVLADPEGNELCVLDGPAPRASIAVVALDAVDVESVAAFWSAALGYEELDRDEGGIGLGPPGGASGLPLDVLRVPEPKTVKGRMHLDLLPDEQRSEVARLRDLGATPAHVGQGDDVPFVVLVDPEGNELCVLPARR